MEQFDDRDSELDYYMEDDTESEPSEPSFSQYHYGDSITITSQSRIHHPYGLSDNLIDVDSVHLTLLGTDESVILNKVPMDKDGIGLYSFSFTLDVPNGVYRSLVVSHYDGWDCMQEALFEVVS